MQFLSISRRRTEQFSDAEFTALLDAESERVRELYRDGIVRSIWSRGDIPGACMLLECNDLVHAQASVASLPLAQKGMLEVQVIPLKGYRAFGPSS